MNRWTLAVCALTLGVLAVSPANASYKVIKWTSGLCQVWDNGIPTMPIPGDWKTMSRNYKTFGGALRKEHRLIAARKCGW